MDLAVLIVIVVVALAVAMFLGATIKVIRQQQIGVVERLGKFHRTLEPGPHLVIPVFDRVRYTLDMREAVVPFPPQGVITEDNLMVSIDSVIYFQVVDPVRAAYEAQNYIQAIEQLTMTTLRNIIGGLDLEQALTSREEINAKLRAVLDDATAAPTNLSFLGSVADPAPWLTRAELVAAVKELDADDLADLADHLPTEVVDEVRRQLTPEDAINGSTSHVLGRTATRRRNR